MEEKAMCEQTNYEIECERLRGQLKQTINELEQYRQALLNVCIKM